jgi:cytochrome b561
MAEDGRNRGSSGCPHATGARRWQELEHGATVAWAGTAAVDGEVRMAVGMTHFNSGNWVGLLVWCLCRLCGSFFKHDPSFPSIQPRISTTPQFLMSIFLYLRHSLALRLTT